MTALYLALAFSGECGAAVSDAKPVELTRAGIEYSSATLKPARMGGEFGIAVVFDGTDDLHFYAKSDTAPMAGSELKEVWSTLGADAGGGTPEEMQAFVASEIAKWSKVVKDSGAKLD